MWVPGKNKRLILFFFLLFGLSCREKKTLPLLVRLNTSPNGDEIKIFHQTNKNILIKKIGIKNDYRNALVFLANDSAVEEIDLDEKPITLAFSFSWLVEKGEAQKACKDSSFELAVQPKKEKEPAQKTLIFKTECKNPNLIENYNEVQIPLEKWKNEKIFLNAKLYSEDAKDKPKLAFALAEPRFIFPEQTQKPNLIIINIDTLSPSHLSLFGYKRKTSPNLEQFSKKCLLFTNTVAQASWTPPSVASLLTSLYPSQHGSTGKDNIPLSPDNLTLAELLREKGYHTVAFSASPFIHPDYGFAQGFDKFEFEDIPKAEMLNQRIFKFLDRNPKETPFFLYIMYFDPHQPYEPPPPYDTMFQKDEKGRDLWQPKKYKGKKAKIAKLKPSIKKELFEFVLSQYDGEIAYTDDQIGKLLKKFEENQLLNNSIILFTSDHGEEFLEHSGFGHGKTLYNEVIKVLFLLYTPNILPNGKINQPVEVVDIMPTLLDIMGIEIHEEISGKSIVQFLKTNEKSSSVQYAQMRPFLKSEEWIRAFYLEHYKLIISKNKKELYKLDTDPKEKNNIAEQKPELLFKIQNEMENFEQNLTKRKISPKIAPSQKTREILRSLGYAR